MARSNVSTSVCDFDQSIERAYRKLFLSPAANSPELLHWRFQANPHGKGRFAVARSGEDVVGMIALVPTRLRNVPGDGLCYQAIDTVVDPSCRGEGLFVRMGTAAQETAAMEAGILWGFPNANAARGWFGRLGWTDFGAVPLLMRPLRSSFLLGRVHPKLKAIDFPLIRDRKDRDPVSIDSKNIAAAFDPLWERVAPAMTIAVDRGGAWMRWRLFDKPGADYRCVGLQSDNGALESFVALKIAAKHGSSICYVMEAISSPERMTGLAGLLRGELARAARHGAEVALAWCPRTAPNYAAYRRAGFVPVPPRFRPIEINFGARALVPERAAAAAPGAPWYISFLDSDTN